MSRKPHVAFIKAMAISGRSACGTLSTTDCNYSQYLQGGGVARHQQSRILKTDQSAAATGLGGQQTAAGP